jgi:hypothetical protein
MKNIPCGNDQFLLVMLFIFFGVIYVFGGQVAYGRA